MFFGAWMRFLSLAPAVCMTAGAHGFSAARPCTTDVDCSLNGVCNSSGMCVCDVPWAGRSCGELRRLPVQPGGAYGYAPNVSSWGASVLPADSGGMFHMFVAEMAGTGLIGWGDHSTCVHAVSDDVHKPFVRSDVVLGAECHGPVALRDPSDGHWLLFHQGNGPAGNESFLRHAPAAGGPWAPTATDAVPEGGCGMPTAAFHPNGTLFLVCIEHVQFINCEI